MPGIAGLITKAPRSRVEPELIEMVESLRHESFYTTGIWIDETAGFYIGWAARPGSFSDGMPIKNEDASAVLVFSGEEYSAPELHNRGYKATVEGPSYLAHLAEEDASFPANLNGRFHGFLARGGHGMLFNDRYGMHRLYYYHAKDAFYFAAEAKAILKVRPELRCANPQALGEYVTCGCALENRTLFRDIHALPPASAWNFCNGAIAQRREYFRPEEWENQECLDEELYYNELKEVFSRNLPRYFKGPQRVAMSLTGGLDTRMIMAWAKCPPGTLPCYSFGGMYRNCQDVIMARRVARACGQDHQTIGVGEEFLANFPRYAERTVYLTDGCVDLTHSPDLYVNECAAKIAPARMTGNYGGEVMRRVRAFKPVDPAAGLFSLDFWTEMQKARQTYARLIGGHPLSFSVFRQAPWHHYGLQALEQTQLSLRSPFLDNDFVKTVFRAPVSATANNGVSLRLIADGDPRLAKLRTDRGLAVRGGPLAATAVQGYLGFTFKAEYAYDYGMPQWVSRIDNFFSALHFERLFLGRHKFYHFRIWYRDWLGEYVKEMLLDPRTLSRPYLNRVQVEAVVHGHLKGGRNYTTEIHKLLTLELIHRLFLDAR